MYDRDLDKNSAQAIDYFGSLIRLLHCAFSVWIKSLLKHCHSSKFRRKIKTLSFIALMSTVHHLRKRRRNTHTLTVSCSMNLFSHCRVRFYLNTVHFNIHKSNLAHSQSFWVSKKKGIRLVVLSSDVKIIIIVSDVIATGVSYLVSHDFCTRFGSLLFCAVWFGSVLYLSIHFCCCLMFTWEI